MTFSIYMREINGSHSSIKFGGYDPTAMPDGQKLTLLKTRNTMTWEIMFSGNPKIGAKEIELHDL